MKTKTGISSEKKSKDRVPTHDRTLEFVQLRVKHREKSEQDLNEMLATLARLSLEQFDTKKNGSRIATVEKSARCARCEEPFEWSWIKLAYTYYVCSLCKKCYCEKCGCATVDLKFISSREADSKEVSACINCAEVVQSYYRKLRFQREIREAEFSPIVNYFNDTKSLKAQVLQLLDRYTDVVSALSCIEAQRFAESHQALFIVLTTAPSTIPLASATVSVANATVSVTESLMKSSKNLLGYMWPVGSKPQSQTSLKNIPLTPQPPSSASNTANNVATTPTPTPTPTPNPTTAPHHSTTSGSVLASNDTLVFTNDSTALINESPATLYEMSEKIEQDIAKSLMTYNRCIKEMSEITVDLDKEMDIIKHIKNSAIDDITEITLTLKTLRKRLIQVELRLLDTIYITLQRMSTDLDAYSFCGVLKDPIERCIEIIEEEIKNKLENIAEKWDLYYEDLKSRVDEVKSEKVINLPTSANVKAQAQRVAAIVCQLEKMAENSITKRRNANTTSALLTLTHSIDQYV
eukprot:TRINITY_DN4058_c0_g1_i1.p1 TRINITY_DN4058_c0_g1~~TRINITY_DN4058_c0_g1_i1.p1  ORF type:complete len:521 (+),score=98.71 TRINITY_DN4058_c0_g1_i1:299-1861(+)